eukprot:IDg2500t1
MMPKPAVKPGINAHHALLRTASSDVPHEQSASKVPQQARDKKMVYALVQSPKSYSRHEQATRRRNGVLCIAKSSAPIRLSGPKQTQLSGESTNGRNELRPRELSS